MILFQLHLFRRSYFHILIYIITMPVNLRHYRGIVGTFSNFNPFEYLKYYLNYIDIAFGVRSFSCSILTTISIFFLSLIFWIFVCNTTKIFLFTRFRKINGVCVIYQYANSISYVFLEHNSTLVSLLMTTTWRYPATL